MNPLLTVPAVLLTYTCWIWPIAFVYELLKCIKAIVRQQEEASYKKHAITCMVALDCTVVNIVLLLLMT